MHWIEKHRSKTHPIKTKIAVLFVFLFLTMSGFPEHTAAQDDIKDDVKVLQTIGTGIIYDDDVASARKMAFSEAMRASVQQALADMMTIEFMVSNFQNLDDLFFKNIEDYILEYKVLTENISGETYRALIESTVFTEKIKDSLEIISSQTDLPIVVLFIAEQNIGDILPLYWWGEEPTFIKGYSERTMGEIFTGEGFSIFDHEGILLDYHDSAAQKKAAGIDADSSSDKLQNGKNMISIHFNTHHLTPEQAVQLGRYLGADIVVTGTALAQTVPNLMGEKTRSFQAELWVRAFLADTGKQIAAVDQQAITVGTDEQSGGRDALSNVGTLAGQALISQIAPVWAKAETRSGQIEILVKGTGTLNHFVTFRKSISEIPGVRNLQVKEIRHNQAILGVNYNKSSQTLAESLMQKSFDNFEVNIFQVTHGRISLEID